MATMPTTYYDRFDRADNYDKSLFLAGRVLQSAELNEVQSEVHDRVQRIADAILKEGDIISGASISVNLSTGLCSCASGAIYLSGSVRGVPSKTLSIATTGTVAVGVYLTESVVTELEDSGLRDPAVGVRNFQEPGAARLQITPEWGFSGSGHSGEFYPVWTVINGVVISKEAPPNLDALSNAIAIYDRQSTGGTYVVSGLRVSALSNLVTGEQVYSVGEGEARVAGRYVKLATSLREIYAATPDLRRITAEPHVSTGPSAQRIDVDRAPIASISSVTITTETTSTITHGSFTGAQDALPNTSVLSIIEVKQGATTYVLGTDYRLTAGKVDWSLTGAEPSPGSTYTCKYQYITTVTPTLADQKGFTVTGAVASTLVQVTYDSALPRYDRLCLDTSGQLVWVNGVSADYFPIQPDVPDSLMLLATIYQTWFTDVTRQVRNDGVRVVAMSSIEDIRNGVLDLYDLMAEQKLKTDVSARSAAAVKGLFVDSFRNSNQRDAGQTQTAVTAFGIMTMPVSESFATLSVPAAEIAKLPFTHTVNLQQTLKTTTMKVNPYMAFAPIPADVALIPAVDHHVVQNVTWSPAITLVTWLWVRATGTYSLGDRYTTSSTAEVLSSTTSSLPNLFQAEVNFTLKGFGPSENLTQVKFDGLDVTSTVAGV